MNEVWYSPADALAVIETYCAAKGWGDGQFCNKLKLELPYGGRQGWVTRLRSGDVRAREIARVVRRCAETWPDGAEWPPFVVQPKGKD